MFLEFEPFMAELATFYQVTYHSVSTIKVATFSRKYARRQHKYVIRSCALRLLYTEALRIYHIQTIISIVRNLVFLRCEITASLLCILNKNVSLYVERHFQC